MALTDEQMQLAITVDSLKHPHMRKFRRHGLHKLLKTFEPASKDLRKWTRDEVAVFILRTNDMDDDVINAAIEAKNNNMDGERLAKFLDAPDELGEELCCEFLMASELCAAFKPFLGSGKEEVDPVKAVMQRLVDQEPVAIEDNAKAAKEKAEEAMEEAVQKAVLRAKQTGEKPIMPKFKVWFSIVKGFYEDVKDKAAVADAIKRGVTVSKIELRGGEDQLVLEGENKEDVMSLYRNLMQEVRSYKSLIPVNNFANLIVKMGILQVDTISVTHTFVANIANGMSELDKALQTLMNLYRWLSGLMQVRPATYKDPKFGVEAWIILTDMWILIRDTLHKTIAAKGNTSLGVNKMHTRLAESMEVLTDPEYVVEVPMEEFLKSLQETSEEANKHLSGPRDQFKSDLKVVSGKLKILAERFLRDCMGGTPKQFKDQVTLARELQQALDKIKWIKNLCQRENTTIRDKLKNQLQKCGSRLKTVSKWLEKQEKTSKSIGDATRLNDAEILKASQDDVAGLKERVARLNALVKQQSKAHYENEVILDSNGDLNMLITRNHAFLVDVSGSVTCRPSQVAELKKFMNQFANAVKCKDDVFTLIWFSSGVHCSCTQAPKHEFITALNAYGPGKPAYGGGTNTAAGLERMFDEFKKSAPEVVNLAYVLTDGCSGSALTGAAAQKIKKEFPHTKIIAVGIGGGINVNELNSIATDFGGKKNVILVKNFNNLIAKALKDFTSTANHQTPVVKKDATKARRRELRVLGVPIIGVSSTETINLLQTPQGMAELGKKQIKLEQKIKITLGDFQKAKDVLNKVLAARNVEIKTMGAEMKKELQAAIGSSMRKQIDDFQAEKDTLPTMIASINQYITLYIKPLPCNTLILGEKEGAVLGAVTEKTKALFEDITKLSTNLPEDWMVESNLHKVAYNLKRLDEIESEVLGLELAHEKEQTRLNKDLHKKRNNLGIQGKSFYKVLAAFEKIQKLFDILEESLYNMTKAVEKMNLASTSGMDMKLALKGGKKFAIKKLMASMTQQHKVISAAAIWLPMIEAKQKSRFELIPVLAITGNEDANPGGMDTDSSQKRKRSVETEADDPQKKKLKTEQVDDKSSGMDVDNKVP